MSGNIMRKCGDRNAPPVVGAMCIVLTEDAEVPLRTAYWCSGVWRDPHTARVPLVLSWCLMSEALDALTAEIDAAMTRLPAAIAAQSAEPIRCPKCGWKAGEA